MTVTKLKLSSLSEREQFEIAGVRPLRTGEDEAFQRLQAIYSLSVVMASALADSKSLGDKSELENLNLEVVKGAWEGIALLAADASFALHSSHA